MRFMEHLKQAKKGTTITLCMKQKRLIMIIRLDCYNTAQFSYFFLETLGRCLKIETRIKGLQSVSADRGSIIPELPQEVTKIVLLCYQLTKVSIFFSPTIQHFFYSYIWSKFEVSMTTVAKVTKFVLLCYQLTKISKNLAQPQNNSYIAISSQNLKSP